MRLECLRLLGNIGTIDSFNYRRTMLRIKRKSKFGWMNSLPEKFRFIDNYHNALQAHNQNDLV